MALSRRKVGVGETARCLCLGERSIGEASRCVMMTMQRRTVSLKQTDALWWRHDAGRRQIGPLLRHVARALRTARSCPRAGYTARQLSCSGLL